MLENLNKLLDSFAALDVPSFDCVVYHHGKPLFRRMHGYSDYEKTTPINGTERYNIYSCSKPITVTAALTLLEKGAYKLDDKLADYMPEFAEMTVREGDTVRPAKTQITIRNLFTMSAGFTYNLASPGLRQAREETDGKCPTRLTMKYLATDPLAFDPGAKYAYSLCHDVLAAFVEEVSGMKFGEYVKKTIFDPLGMKDSTFLLPLDQIDTLAAQYHYNNDTKTFDNCGRSCVYRIGTEYESGGAGCVTTVDDYMKFLEALRVGDVILKKETIDLMSTPMLTPEQLACFDLRTVGYSYGLGVRCPMNVENAPTDFGWGGAAAAYLVCDRANDCTLYYAQHTLNAPNQAQRRLLSDVIREDLK